MSVQLTYKELLNDKCPWIGCKFNTSGMCASETSLMKRSIYQYNLDEHDTIIECTNAMARDFNTDILSGYQIHGGILRDKKESK